VRALPVAATRRLRVAPREGGGERVLVDASVSVEDVDHRQRHRRVVGPRPRRRRRSPPDQQDADLAREEALPERVADRQPLEREPRAMHAVGVVGGAQ
jgi:hypothetical protein